MSQHSVADARNHLSDLIARAEKGETVVITRHGAPVVELRTVSNTGTAIKETDIEWLRRRRATRAGPTLNAAELVAAMREEDDQRLLRR